MPSKEAEFDGGSFSKGLSTPALPSVARNDSDPSLPSVGKTKQVGPHKRGSHSLQERQQGPQNAGRAKRYTPLTAMAGRVVYFTHRAGTSVLPRSQTRQM